jgi:hypothetical protein
VLELRCCAYKAAARGDGGSILLEGTNSDGTEKFQDDVVPTRSEEERAQYVSMNIGLLRKEEMYGAFVYVFSYLSMRLGEGVQKAC